jgi:hypothetical protein
VFQPRFEPRFSHHAVYFRGSKEIDIFCINQSLSVVGIAVHTTGGLSSIPDRVNNFLHEVQTGSGAHIAPFLCVPELFPPGNKAVLRST